MLILLLYDYFIDVCIYIESLFIHVEKNVMYRLIGCVIHHNLSSQTGHYTSYVWDHEQSVWFYANDEKVNQITKAELC